MDDSYTPVLLGAPWPNDLFTLPTDTPSMGWHFSGQSPFLVLGDPFSNVNSDVASAVRFTLGFARFESLMVVALRADDARWPFLTMESPRAFLEGDVPPEVPFSNDGEHLLWQMVTVSGGVVANIRAFTTSPEVSVFLRQGFASQRAHGAVTFAESDTQIARWRLLTPSEDSIWEKMDVVCHSGD